MSLSKQYVNITEFQQICDKINKVQRLVPELKKVLVSESLYIDKNIKLSRSKLRMKGYKIVLNPEKADHIVTFHDLRSNYPNQKFAHYSNYYLVKYLDYKYENGQKVYFENISYVKESFYENRPEKFTKVDELIYYKLNNIGNNIELDTLLNNSNKLISVNSFMECHDESDQKVELDLQMYDTLDGYLKSNDSSINKLALELMTNLKIENFYILQLLLKKHGRTIRYNSYYNSVSFLSFREFLQAKGINITTENRSNYFMEAKKLVKTELDLLVYQKECEKYIKDNLETQNVNIKIECSLI